MLVPRRISDISETIDRTLASLRHHRRSFLFLFNPMIARRWPRITDKMTDEVAAGLGKSRVRQSFGPSLPGLHRLHGVPSLDSHPDSGDMIPQREFRSSITKTLMAGSGLSGAPGARMSGR